MTQFDQAEPAAMEPFDVGTSVPYSLTTDTSRGFLQDQQRIGGPQLGQPPEVEEDFSLFDLSELFTAPIYGVEGFFSSLAKLSDMVLGWGVPDFWDDRPSIRSKSVVGGFIEGMTQFLTGFIPIAGPLSRGAQFTFAAKGVAAAASKFGAKKFAKTLVSKAGTKATVKNIKDRVAVDIAAGAVADFTAFDGHEERLSNFIQGTFLENPVTEFLAADEDDSALEGRIKNLLEGGALGLMADSFIEALRAMRHLRRGRGANLSQRELEDLQDASVDGEKLHDSVDSGGKAHDEEVRDATPPDSRTDDQAFREEANVLDPDYDDTRSLLEARKAAAQAQKQMDEATTAKQRGDAEVAKAAADARTKQLLREAEQRDEMRAAIPDDSEAFREKQGDGEGYALGEWGRPIYAEQIEGEWYQVTYNPQDRVWVNAETLEPLTGVNGTRAEAAKRIRSAATGKKAAEAIERGEVPASSATDAIPVQRALATLRKAKENLAAGEDLPDVTHARPAEGRQVLSAEELVEWSLRRENINLARMDPRDKAVVRAIEQLYDEAFEADLRPQTLLEIDAKATDDLMDMTGHEFPVELLNDKELSRAGKEFDRMAEEDLLLARKLSNRKRAWVHILKHNAQEFKRVGAKVMEGGTPDDILLAKAELGAVHARLMAATRAVTGLKNITGRDLSAMRIAPTGYERIAERMRQSPQWGQEDGLHKLAERLAATDDVFELAREARMAARSKTKFDALIEVWINGILGGGRTIAINIWSNSMLLVWKPLEKMAGAAIAGNAPGVREATLDWGSYVRRFTASMRVAWESGVKNEPIVLAGGKLSELGQGHAFVPETFGVDPNSGLGRIITVFGRWMRYPSSMLTGGDDMAKYMNVHADAETLLARIAWEKGMDPEEAATFAATHLDDLTYKHQVMTEDVLFEREYDNILRNESHKPEFSSRLEMINEASERASKKWNSRESSITRLLASHVTRRAEEGTHTRPIPKDGTAAERLTYHAQQAVASVPILRFFVTFIKTPFNIILWARDRSVDPMVAMFKLALSPDLRSAARSVKGGVDFNAGRAFMETNKVKNRFLRDILGDVELPPGVEPGSAEGRAVIKLAREEALGRVAAGVGMATTFVTLAEMGLVTGRGPTDKEQRELLQASGWQPYSLKIGDSYVEYRRIDPWATMLGTIADYVTYGKYAPLDDQDRVLAMGAALVASLANNATNKTYMTGIKNLVEVLTEPERHADTFMSKMAASFVPTGPSEVMTTLAGWGTDPLLRENYEFVDALLSKSIPYYGEERDPVRNFIGEPVRRIRSLGADEIGSVMNLFVPIAYNEVSDDLIMEEIASLKHSFQPPRAIRGGVDLRTYRTPQGQSAFDRSLELRNELTLGGKKLRRALRDLMRSRAYKMMDPMSSLEVDSPRIGEINRVIGRYDRAAMNQMRREFPEVSSDSLRIRREMRRARFSALQQVR